MKLELQNIGKRYHDRWLFRSVSLHLETGQSLSVTGRNGSGKSTLLQIVYGLIQASEGKVILDSDEHFRPDLFMASTSPSMDLPMEFSIGEIHALYLSLNKMSVGLNEFSDFALFSKADIEKPVKHFSSGMLQRLKTALCLQSGAPVLLLDEPLTNMDRYGEDWYMNCLPLLKNKICLVAGNTEKEVSWTERNLNISND